MEVPKPPAVVNPLTVSMKHGKQRLVLDLRYINKYLNKQACKIEGAETLMRYLPGATHLYGFDLKAGYHHVDMHPSQHCLLGFAYPDHTGKHRFFTFKVLPFGLSSAGFIFTKVLRVLIRHWRAQMIRVVTFFDDGLGTAQSIQEGLLHSNIVHTDLILAGFVPNKSKSIWYPSAVLAWLGFIYDLINKMIKASPDKVGRTSKIIADVLAMDRIPVRTLASAVGSITALYLAYGDLVYLKTKLTQMIVGMGEDWGRKVTLTPVARDELTFWLNYLPNHNGMAIQHPVAAGVITYSDASETGCAAIVSPYPDRQEFVIHWQFDRQEIGTSSTYRELVAGKHGLQQARALLENQSVRWFTDSSNVVSIVRKGSMVPSLLKLALEIFTITRRYNINLAMTWISRDHNTKADLCSRIIEYDDWGIHPKWYAHIVSNLGTPQFDRFADQHNTKTVLYNSRFYTDTTSGIDCFTQDWRGYLNWLVPPIHMIGRTLAYMMLLRCEGILVVPVWYSSYFWPLLQNIIREHPQVVIGKLTLGDIYVHYQNKAALFGSSQWQGETMAIRLNFQYMPQTGRTDLADLI